MSRLTAFVLVLFMGVDLFGTRAVAGGPDGTAADFVAGLGQKAIQIVSEHEENGAHRRERLRDLVEDALSIKSMAKTVIGSDWKFFAPEQQDRFVEVFRRYLLNYCVGLLDNRMPDGFSVESAKPINAFDTRVTTRVKRGNWTLANFDWVVREIDGGYRIVDVAMNGLSVVTTYNSEFRSVIARNGIEGLILALAHKAPNLSAAAAAATVQPQPVPSPRLASSP